MADIVRWGKRTGSTPGGRQAVRMAAESVGEGNLQASLNKLHASSSLHTRHFFCACVPDAVADELQVHHAEAGKMPCSQSWHCNLEPCVVAYSLGERMC